MECVTNASEYKPWPGIGNMQEINYIMDKINDEVQVCIQ
jgi:hypothetical protein